MFLKRFQGSGRYLISQLTKTRNSNKPCLIHSHGLHSKSNGDLVHLCVEGESLKFPAVWLRDNCQCEKCFHQSAKSRIVDFSAFNVNVKATNIVENEKSVKIIWDDGHASLYKSDWLKLRSFTPKNQKWYLENIYKPSKTTWNGDEFQKICSKHDYNQILNSDKALHDWLYNLAVYGVALIENAPISNQALGTVVRKVAFPKQTHYGVSYVVQNIANTSNVAYLSSNLQMHTDLPYYEYCPGVNMLHCLVQTESAGGENLLSDAHYVAQFMKENHPEQYRLLTDTEVEWCDIGIQDGMEFFKLYRSPVICLDKTDGEITRVNFSVPQRGSYFPGSNVDDVKPWYHALSLFFELNNKLSAQFKTRPGDILVFDNIRLLHGRKSYEDNATNVRKLIGTYVDWDEVYSKLRCLQVKLGKYLN